MHKNFYASGFIYHPQSERILLQQNNNVSTLPGQWVLFEFEYSEKENPEELFKNVISELLDIKVKQVFPVYFYFNENKKRNQSILYTTVNKLHDFTSKKDLTFKWFSFKDVLKLHVTDQTKHDIVVGQRVIEAAKRKSLGLHTFQ